ncbi:MAG: SRPBCC family protein [Acidimicrobiales bacterium]
MARFITTVTSPQPAPAVFDLLADMTNTPHWDPGVLSAEQTVGEGGGLGATFVLTVSGWRRPLAMTYRTVEYEAPHRVRFVAETARLRSDDEITLAGHKVGCSVTYATELHLTGWARFADPLLRAVFRRIGNEAAAGLAGIVDARAPR